MSLESEFFRGLYQLSPLPVLVYNGNKPVYISDSMKELMERYHLNTAEQLLPEDLRAEYEASILRFSGSVYKKIIMDAELTFSVTPYPFDERVYGVISVIETPASSPDQEKLFDIVENLKGKMNQYLDLIYGAAEMQGIESETYREVSTGVLRIMRLTDHFARLLGQDEDAVHYLVPVDVGAFAANCVAAVKQILPFAPLQKGGCGEKVFAGMMPEEMELVLTAMISNGLRFCNSRVTVSTGRQGGKVYIAVADDGEGMIDPNRLPEWGYCTPDRRGQSGLGFSLVVARKLLEQQNASLEYERAGGQTVFRIVMDEVEDPSLGRLAEWRPEDQENRLSQMRIELSDYFDYNKTEENR